MSNSSQVCLCGRAFTHVHALTNHQHECRHSKVRLAGALARAKDFWHTRKRRRLDTSNTGNELRNLDNAQPDKLDLSSVRPSELLDGASSHCGEVPVAAIGISQMDIPTEHEDLSLAQRRTRRVNTQLPKRFRDNLPQPPPLLALVSSIVASVDASLPQSPPSTLHLRSRILKFFRTPKNLFGLSRQYFSDKLPTHDPDQLVSLNDLCHDTDSQSTQPDLSYQSIGTFFPYPNQNSFRLGDWFWNGGEKSQGSFKELLDIVGDPSFQPSDVRHTKWSAINAALASNDLEDEDEWTDTDAGWMRKPISISVPFHQRTALPGPRQYVGAELYHRSIVKVVRERITDPQHAEHFHYEPYWLMWQPTDRHAEVRLHGELYTSEAFFEAHLELQNSPAEPNCNLPRVIVALMFWSDATHLTSFGNAKLWPLYLYFGNESKYRRCKPSFNLCCHVAYFQTLPGEFMGFAADYTGSKAPSNEFRTHCEREFMHEQLKILFDDEFIVAYHHGMVIDCYDSIARRFYLRVFSHSGDYKDKYLWASIRSMGLCPCPRCMILKVDMHNLGTAKDRQQRSSLKRSDNAHRQIRVSEARRLIYEKNYAVGSEVVEKLLKDESLVPTSNAYSERLRPFGLDLFRLFLVDLMHEFELGVWKALLIHLLRILASVNRGLLLEFDSRFRQVPTFGRDTIRKFSSNTSELRKLAAGNYEDILQCIIPVFDGLLPEPHNGIVMRLLFTCVHWHSLAKLRMHTDITLDIMDDVTTSLGKAFREFQTKVCPCYQTYELPREEAARYRRKSKKAKKGENSSAQSNPPAKPKARVKRELNIQTYKFHSLGDYVETIRRYGTTDSYTTEVGELEHRNSKARYRRTDRKTVVKQLTQIERRQARIRRIRQKHQAATKITNENVANTPEEHHHIGKSEKCFEEVGDFLRLHSGDPAVKNFYTNLRKHILARVSQNPHSNSDLSTSQANNPEPTEVDPNHILLQRNRIYRHNIMRINYTTYDIRRGQDTINPATSHNNVMVLANDLDDGDNISNHPFIYARVLGIFHANVVLASPVITDYRPRRVEFLWVRWYERLSESPAGWATSTLDRLRFPPMVDEDSFGFLDPADVLRGTHIIPRFVEGRRRVDGKGLSRCAQDCRDWRMYLVNRFVDCDMVLRYHWSEGVGHLYAHHRSSSDPSVTWKNGARTANNEPEHDGNSRPSYAGRESTTLSQESPLHRTGSPMMEGRAHDNSGSEGSEAGDDVCLSQESSSDETAVSVDMDDLGEAELLGFDEMYHQ